MAIEYLRPTADANSTISEAAFGTDVVSSSMSAVYTGKSGVGPVGASSGISLTASFGGNTYTARVFTGFTALHSYSSLILNVSESDVGSDNDNGLGGYVTFSQDGGVSFGYFVALNPVLSDGQATYTIDITGTNLANLQVLVFLQAPQASSPQDSATITIYDIWVAGTYSTGSITFDDDSAQDFWGGVQKCASSVALGACLAATALSTACAQSVVNQHQDDPAGNLYGVPEEVYWQNEVSPVSLSMGKLYLPDPEEIPAHTLKGQPDEDFWTSGVSPVPLTLTTLRDTFPYLPDPEEIPAHTLHGLPEEELWQNRVAPVPLTIWQELPYEPDPEEIPAGKLHGQPDEDYWQNPVRPVPLTIWQELPYEPDTEEIPAHTLHGQPEEEFWVNAVAPVLLTFEPLYLPDPEEIPAATLHGLPEEEFWVNAVAPVPLTIGKLYLPEPEELPAGSLYGLPEEELWQNQVAPVATSIYQRLPIGDPEEIPAGSLHGQPDEDLWVNWVVPVSLTLQWPQQWQFEQNESPTLHGQPDEDLWINPVFPAQNILTWPQQWTFEQNEPAGSLYGVLDDGTGVVLPRPIAPWIAQPFTNDTEFTYQVLTIVDEDYWQNPVSPQVLGNTLFQLWALEQNDWPYVTPVTPAAFVIWIVDDFG